MYPAIADTACSMRHVLRSRTAAVRAVLSTRRMLLIALALWALATQVPLACAAQHVGSSTRQTKAGLWDHPVRFTGASMTQFPVKPVNDGPFGIDHLVPYDNHGIWKRQVQMGVEYTTLATVLGGAIALGDHNKLGDTFWRSLDAVAVSAAAAQVLKHTFQRERPSQTSNPDEFFQGFHDESFPSGEVTAISAAVTPFILRYGHGHPAVYALAALPLYDAMARVKVHGHWQSDVIAGAVLGTLVGVWATHRNHSLLVGWLPGGFSIGYVHRF